MESLKKAESKELAKQSDHKRMSSLIYSVNLLEDPTSYAPEALLNPQRFT
jgi:hypothetical protein